MSVDSRLEKALKRFANVMPIQDNPVSPESASTIKILANKLVGIMGKAEMLEDNTLEEVQAELESALSQDPDILKYTGGSIGKFIANFILPAILEE